MAVGPTAGLGAHEVSELRDLSPVGVDTDVADAGVFECVGDLGGLGRAPAPQLFGEPDQVARQVAAGVVGGPLVLPVIPNVVDALAARVPFQLAFVTVTVLPVTDGTPFQSWLMVWPAGSVQVICQPDNGVAPLLRTVTSAWNPPDHWPVMA